MLYGEFCILTIMMASWSTNFIHQTINAFVFHMFIFLALFSHLKTMLTDPGAIPKGNATDEYIHRLQSAQNSIIYKCAKWSVFFSFFLFIIKTWPMNNKNSLLKRKINDIIRA